MPQHHHLARSRTRLGAAVPFNDNINFHKVVAAGAAVGVALHVVLHLTCDFPRLLHASDAAYEPMKAYFGQMRIPNYWWFVKGVEGITGVIMVVLMAVAYTLAHPWFRRGKLSEGNPFESSVGSTCSGTRTTCLSSCTLRSLCMGSASTSTGRGTSRR